MLWLTKFYRAGVQLALAICERKYIKENTKDNAELEPVHIYGEHRNVLLRRSELEYLREKYPACCDIFIDALSYDIYFRKRQSVNYFEELKEKLKEGSWKENTWKQYL